MLQNQESAELNLFDLEELAEPKNRVKMCYAFMVTKHLFHQEIAIMNPAPSQFVPGYVFPKDFYKYAHHNDSGEEVLSLEELQKIAAEADAPITCIGSHLKEEDRTLQLIALPQSMATADLKPMELIVVRFLIPVTIAEKQKVMEELKREYLLLQE